MCDEVKADSSSEKQDVTEYIKYVQMYMKSYW